jgi:glycine/D-amino acid oxidase-like deaminating enzyme
MQRPFESPAYDTTRWPDSHWRTDCETLEAEALYGKASADIAIIGAGYTGLNAALELVERHGMDVAMLDAAQPGWAASGRNGGFACTGGAKLSPRAIAARVGDDGAREVARFQHMSVEAVDANLMRYGINADRGPDGEVALAHNAADWVALQRAAAEERAAYGANVRLIPREDLRAAGLHSPAFHGAAAHPVGFPLHPLKYLTGLAGAAQAAGVRIYGESPVSDLRREGGQWVLRTEAGVMRARRVLIATNGYSSDDLPDWIGGRFLPALSTILVTRPLSEEERQIAGWTSQQMSFDTRRLLHYFRLLPDGRFLFGMRGGLSARAAALQRTGAEARAHLNALFPQWAGIATERTWSGLVCLTPSLAAYAGPVPGAEGLFAAFGWHGNGVATGTLAGRRIAAEIAGGPVDIPRLFRRAPRPLPPRLRLWAMRLAYVVYGVLDGPMRRSYS